MAASLVRLGDFLYCAIWTIAGILLFEGPPLIFAYCGFFSPLTKTLDLIGIVVSCPVLASASWLTTMTYVLARI
jgi:hypothetical protein